MTEIMIIRIRINIRMFHLPHCGILSMFYQLVWGRSLAKCGASSSTARITPLMSVPRNAGSQSSTVMTRESRVTSTSSGTPHDHSLTSAIPVMIKPIAASNHSRLNKRVPFAPNAPT